MTNKKSKKPKQVTKKRSNGEERIKQNGAEKKLSKEHEQVKKTENKKASRPKSSTSHHQSKAKSTRKSSSVLNCKSVCLGLIVVFIAVFLAAFQFRDELQESLDKYIHPDVLLHVNNFLEQISAITTLGSIPNEVSNIDKTSDINDLKNEHKKKQDELNIDDSLLNYDVDDEMHLSDSRLGDQNINWEDVKTETQVETNKEETKEEEKEKLKVEIKKEEPKVEVKEEPKVEVKEEPKVEVKEEPKVGVKKEEPKLVVKKEEPKVEVKKDEPKVEVKKEEPKVEVKKDEPKEVKKEEPKVEVKKDEPKEVKKEEPKVEVKKDEPKEVKKDDSKEVKKEEPKVEVKKDEPKEVKKDEPKEVKKDEPKVEVKKEEPKVDVKKDEPKEVKKEEPKVEVKKVEAKVEVKKEEPKVEVKKEEPKVDVKKEEPKVDVKKEEPKVEVKKDEPKVEVKKDEPKVEVKKDEPKVEVKKEKPKVEVKKEEPKVEVKKEEPKAKVKKEEPKVEVKKDEPKEVKKEEPKVEVKKEEPKVEVKKEESKVEVKKEDPEVDVKKEEPKVEVKRDVSKSDIRKTYNYSSITNDADLEIHDELDEADSLFKEEKYEDAVKKYDVILRKHLTSPRAYYGKGLALDKLGFKYMSNEYLERAIDFLARVLNLQNVPDDLYKLAGRKLADRQQFRGWGGESIKTYKKMSEKFPDDLSLKNEFGVLVKNPNSGFAKAHLGFILKAKDNRLEEAVKLLKEGIETQEPGTVDGRFYLHLGDSLIRLGREAEARKYFKEAKEKGLFLSEWQRSLYNVNNLTGRPWWTAEQTGYQKYLNLLQENWETIRDEGLAQLDAATGSFLPEEENLRETGDWKQFTLFQQGRKNGKNCEKAPKTCALIDQIPDAKSCKRGQVKFSVMSPGIHVWPHAGPTNCRIRAHLGLVVPEGPIIRVVNETRTWKEGHFIIFDDSFEHEVWHKGKELRLVLIIDFWHPELTEAQRRGLSAI
ncbi:hypothetical protein Btru_041970 [Bulinus truncatus]|nr:hypothetical protein Btru_041970 [Bulinus truncatus]